MKVSLKEICALRKLFSSLRVLIVGDVMLDRYYEGEVERISPEAPVPVVRVVSKKENPGGAGNTAFNVSKLGAKSYIAGIVGDDEEGEKLNNILKSYGVNSLILVESGRKTTLKTRITSKRQQILRFDEEDTKPIDPSVEKKLLNKISSIINDVDGIIVSDYAKGTITPRLMKFLKKSGVPLYVDPKPSNALLYKAVQCLCPNMKEAGEISGLSSNKLNPQVLAEKIWRKLKVEKIIITMGEDGAFLYEKRRGIHIKTRKRNVFDVTGAGDTFISAYTLSELAGKNSTFSVHFANMCAGIVVEKPGAVAPEFNEIIREFRMEKMLREE